MDEDDDLYDEPAYDNENCNCPDCRMDRGEDELEEGEHRGFCTACDTPELHFLEDEEIYVCDCEAAALLANNPDFPIKLHHPLPELTHA